MTPCTGPWLIGRRPLVGRGDKRELGVLKMRDMPKLSKI